MVEQFENNYQTQLNGAINNSVTTLTVDSAPTTMTGQFRIIIDNEIILVDAVSGLTFTGCTRGAEGTTAAAHTDNTPVTHIITAEALESISGGSDLDTYPLDLTYGDDFTGPSLSVKWTRRNFLAAAETYQEGKAATYMRIAMTGRAAGDGYFQTAPSGDWTFAMAQVPRAQTNARLPWSLCVIDSSGTGLGMTMHNSPNAPMTAGITTYSTYSGVFQQMPTRGNTLPSSDSKVWTSLRKSGTNYYGSLSFDGEIWMPETPAFSSAITVDRIGMIVHPLGGILTTAHVDVDWFNKTA